MMAASSSSTTAAAAGSSPYRSRFGDTTQTKVFVGGLAWETPSEGLRQHFEQYGDILEAVVITDRLTGRSKGYGFVTFRDADAARRAVQDPNPTITGRRANCNIASLGPPRPAQQQQQARGRASTNLQIPVLQGPHFFPRAPQPHMPGLMPQPQHHGAAIYHHHPSTSQYGYWYPSDYQYQQAAMMNHQALQNYYAQLQLYGLPSPTAPPPYHHHQYVGYLPTPSRGRCSRRRSSSLPRRTCRLPRWRRRCTAPSCRCLLSRTTSRCSCLIMLPRWCLPTQPVCPVIPTINSAFFLIPNLQSAAVQTYSAASATNTNNTHQGA
ncbi:hypothetical protein ACQ4PT_005909 [Festuca glaucescens]